MVILDVDFKLQLNAAYYAFLLKTPLSIRGLADLISYNDPHPDLEKQTDYRPVQVGG